MARGMDYPFDPNANVSLVTVGEWTKANEGDSEVSERKLNGLGDVISDITTGNFAALPGDIVTGLSTGDVGSYIIVGVIAFFVLPVLIPNSKSEARLKSKRARLIGQVAKDKALL